MIELSVTGCRHADAPATFGQRAVWSVLEQAGDEGIHFNLGCIVEVPSGTALRDVIVAVQRVVERHDTLRTTFEVRDGALRQVVASEGSLAITVHPSPHDLVDETTVGVRDALVRELFRLTREWPIRATVVTEGAQPRRLVLAFSPMALDRLGWRIVERSLHRLLVDVAADHPSTVDRQPVDEAHYECSAPGQAANQRALARWDRLLRSAPTTQFDFTPTPEKSRRYWMLRMDSSALPLALATVALRTGTTDGAVLLAAVSAAFGVYCGHDEALVVVNVANRIRKGTASTAGYFAWDSLFSADFRGLGFDDRCHQAYRDAFDTYRHGTYDHAAAEVLRRTVEHDRGAYLDLGFHLNDFRDRNAAALALVREITPDFDTLRKATRVRVAEIHDRSDARFHVHAGDREPEYVTLEAMVDTRYVPVARTRRILRGIENLVIAAAGRDLSSDAIAGCVNVTPAARGSGWHRYDGGWVHLPAVRLMWSELIGPTGAIFMSKDSEGGSELVAYYASDKDCAGVRILHAEVVAWLVGRSDVRAPDRYVRCFEGPRDLLDEDAWRHMTILEQGTGR
jgi:hypothetical protein